ncbi:unnamed protein product [Bursaphelenchus xylophilus]|uniref:(pine wood nematode) hypothetical protein n=1 Tax=Bursaphelenchus xylophilus TaxID=6326 RepID=A0A1I7SEN3_BURXY|nr:unnamed protein product [Bursaphelenchus xylophilus]CAG9092903.1 unnamed protein product [Bursaphelenchus xylophilus]
MQQRLVALLLLPAICYGFRKPQEVDWNIDIKKEEGDKYYRANIEDNDLVDVYQKWAETGLSSLMSAVANHKLKRQRKSISKKYGECSSGATDIPKHARCLTKLLNNQIKPEIKPKKHRVQRLEKYQPVSEGGFRIDDEHQTRSKRSMNRTSDTAQGKAPTYQIYKKDRYPLYSNKEQLTPIGQIAKILVESIKKLNNKTELPRWQNTVEKLKINGAKRKKFKKLVENDSEENMNQIQMKSLRNKLTGKKEPTVDVDIEEMAENPEKLKNFVKNRKTPKNYEEKVMDLIRRGVKLGYSFAGKNTTNFEDKNMKLVSPRFLGVVPEENQDDDISLVSPSLFSLHSQGQGIENITSLPNLLKGFTGKDQQLWLDVIMEAAGVNEQSDMLEDDVKNIEFNKTMSLMTNMTHMVNDKGEPMYATKKDAVELGASEEYIKMFETLHQNYTKDQLREMNSTGYSVLTKHQIEILYGPNSPEHRPDVYHRLMNMTSDQIRDRMHEDFHTLAKLEKFSVDYKSDHQRRRKRQLLPGIILSPVLLVPAVLQPLLASEPFILSPIVLTPLILSPSVFGAIILSPWLFVPVILSPRVLGTLILAPFVFSPLILSPFALHPAILSPGVFSPLILSPSVMLPLILSPTVFSPIILSPICMAPLILSPSVGSPIILSPFVLTPIIGSPLSLSGLILSPYALSPVIFSPLFVFIAVLSPSWLS